MPTKPLHLIPAAFRFFRVCGTDTVAQELGLTITEIRLGWSETGRQLAEKVATHKKRILDRFAKKADPSGRGSR